MSLENQRTPGPTSAEPRRVAPRALTPTTAPRREHGLEPRRPHLDPAAAGLRVAGASASHMGRVSTFTAREPPLQAPTRRDDGPEWGPTRVSAGRAPTGVWDAPTHSGPPSLCERKLAVQTHGQDHSTRRPALRRDFSRGPSQRLVSTSGLRVKDVGGQAGHLRHQTLKATCHAGGDRDVTPADPGDSRPPGRRPPLSDLWSRDWAGGRRLSGEKVEGCFLYAPRLLRACTCVCAPVRALSVCARVRYARCTHVCVCVYP